MLGYVAGFLIVGRPDNDCWGVMIAPLWPLGLIKADRSGAAFVAALRGRFAAGPRVAA